MYQMFDWMKLIGSYEDHDTTLDQLKGNLAKVQAKMK